MARKKREAWEVEAQITRNVAEAVERVVRDFPKGGDLDLIWRTVEAFKVDREIFDRAIWVLTTQGRARRIKDRLYPPARSNRHG